MVSGDAIETALNRAFDTVTGPTTPPKLRAAMRHAVFPGGGRVRPRLAVEVARACGDEDPEVAMGAAAAIELLHCASLVHDDLPCFDNAALRRGRPSVHAAFGQELAVLVGDGLIVAAYEVLGHASRGAAHKLGDLISVLSAGVGSVRGIVAGQAWESEAQPDLRLYHRAKTGALFEAAVCAGAIAGGGDPAKWRALGGAIGEAYQVADDILDMVGTSRSLGKPVGQDSTLGRPSAALTLGVEGAHARLDTLVDRILSEVPQAPGRARFQLWLGSLCEGIFPARTPTPPGRTMELRDVTLTA